MFYYKNIGSISTVSTYSNPTKIGCFSDQKSKRDLNGAVLYNLINNQMTIEKCLDFCYSRNFYFAGLQNSWE